jgi:uroporphyrinogen-III decarboxylase
MHGSREEITRDVHEHIDRLGGGGGYICASSHDLHPLIPLENFYAMRDAVHAYRFTRPTGALPIAAPAIHPSTHS